MLFGLFAAWTYLSQCVFATLSAKVLHVVQWLEVSRQCGIQREFAMDTSLDKFAVFQGKVVTLFLVSSKQ